MTLAEDGKYTITLKDEAGNSTSVTFTIDQTKPVYTALGLLNLTHYNEKGDVTVANIGDKDKAKAYYQKVMSIPPMDSLSQEANDSIQKLN